MSDHSCNHLCHQSDLLHWAQKVLEVENEEELREICEKILSKLKLYD